MTTINATPLPPAADHAAWLEQRRHGVGSSDASAILGLSTYESPYSLWEIKTGRAPLDVPVSGQLEELRRWGNLLEPVILQEVARELGIPLTKPTTAYRHNERHWQVCNLDGWDNTNRRPAEIKNVHLSQRHLWHGQTPDHAEIQVHHSAAVTQADHAIIAGLIGGSHLIIHEIEVNLNVVDMITEAEEKFWEHVTTDTPPPLDGHIRTMEAITREWAHKPGSREVTQDQAKPLWEAWAAAHEAHKEAEKNKKKYAAELAKLMDGHTSLTTGKHTWATARRGRLNMTRLSDEHPELMKEYTRKPSFDLDAFKHDHPDLYDTYRYTSVQPTPSNK